MASFLHKQSWSNWTNWFSNICCSAQNPFLHTSSGIMEAVRNGGSVKIIFSALEVWDFEGVLPYFQDFFVAGFKCRCLIIRNGSRNQSQNTRTPQRKGFFENAEERSQFSGVLCSQLWPCPRLFLSSINMTHAILCKGWPWQCGLGPSVSSGFELHGWDSHFITKTSSDRHGYIPAGTRPPWVTSEGSNSFFPFFSKSLLQSHGSASFYPSFFPLFSFFLRSISCFSPNLSFCLVNLEGVLGVDSDQQRLWRAPKQQLNGLYTLPLWDLLSRFVLSIHPILAVQTKQEVVLFVTTSLVSTVSFCIYKESAQLMW